VAANPTKQFSLDTLKVHFVEQYREHIRNLIASYPLDRAMSLAIGGQYEAFGQLERDMLIFLGLQPDHYLVDIGCGSGRLAKALRDYLTGKYLGTDVVPELLDYARQQGSKGWRVELVEGLDIPERDGVADMVCFFSVLTHLLHEESFYYLRESIRVLKPGGKVVFSFLDITQPAHWAVFERNTNNLGSRASLDVFLSQDMIRVWCQHLNVELVELRDGSVPWVPLSRTITHDDGVSQVGLGTLGQSVAVLRKPHAG